tara:strand:- start:2032 stop:3120 length:1089 start_codon:yes stop_codon:yes gene_type:complete
MNIGVNARHLIEDKLEGIGWYSYEILKRIVRIHKEHKFYFFYDRKTKPLVISKNVINIYVKPPARHPFLFNIWFNYRLTSSFKKYNIHTFFSPDGFLSLRTNIKQIGVIHDLNFEHYPKDLPKGVLNYYKKNMPLFAHKASKIVTVSKFSRKDICDKYTINPQKVKVVYNGGNEFFTPLSIEERFKFNKAHNNGRPYFIYVGSLHKRKNIERMLKAFKSFNTKKEMDFIIIGEKMWQNQLNLKGLLENVIFLGRKSGEELSKWVASSAAMVYVSYFEGFGLPVLEGMMAGVPVVTSSETSIPEVGGDAVIYTDPFSIESIRDGLFEAVKDSNFEFYSKKGIDRANFFSWDKSATEISNLLTK